MIARVPAVLALGAGLAMAAAGAHAASTSGATVPAPVWTEIKWPFLMDEWGIGRAFQCKAGDKMVRPSDKQVKIW